MQPKLNQNPSPEKEVELKVPASIQTPIHGEPMVKYFFRIKPTQNWRINQSIDGFEIIIRGK